MEIIVYRVIVYRVTNNHPSHPEIDHYWTIKQSTTKPYLTSYIVRNEHAQFVQSPPRALASRFFPSEQFAMRSSMQSDGTSRRLHRLSDGASWRHRPLFVLSFLVWWCWLWVLHSSAELLLMLGAGGQYDPAHRLPSRSWHSVFPNWPARLPRRRSLES
jgi:hypothetical protein